MNTKILIVDDSAYTRQMIKKMIEEEAAGLEVVGIAADGIDAMAKTMRLKPDIITLDFEMPEMDGFSFLRWLMKERPTPVIMVSSYNDTKTVFKALELGAVDFIAKPTKRASIELSNIAKDLLTKLRGIKEIRLDILSRNLEMLSGEGNPEAEIAPGPQKGMAVRAVAIGSSTGGPAALQIILKQLPRDFPAAVVVSQHMPKGFTGPLAERLNRISDITIREARDNEPLEPGVVLICPGGKHMGFVRKGREIIVQLIDGSSSDKYTPSVDHMMSSISGFYSSNTVGVILTGMGNDGRSGIVDIKKRGGYTIAESEETAVVYGMPGEAVKAGGVEKILPLPEIPAEIIRAVNILKS